MSTFRLAAEPSAIAVAEDRVHLAPHSSWNWCWYGKAAEAVGEKDEAIAAYERALELEADGDQETEAT